MSTPADQYVRDLLWVVNSPAFVEGDDVAADRALSSNEVDASHLESFLNGPGEGEHRVGRYFERLLGYWFRHVRNVEMVASGMQIKDGKRTVGEIDFLYRDEGDQLVHCEASVKFFLHLAGHTPSEFPGPNATDNYERKTAKLFDKQLRVSEEHVPDVDRREGFVKGIMFYRGNAADSLLLPTELPERLPARHGRGQWMRESELEVLGSLGDVVFAIADKPHWLAPAVDASCLDRSTFAEEMAAHFASRRYPVMVSVRESGDRERELKRMFVVADDWPAHHSGR